MALMGHHICAINHSFAVINLFVDPGRLLQIFIISNFIDDLTVRTRSKRRIRKKKERAKIEYNKKNKEVKKSLRTDKRECANTLAREAEEAARNGNIKRFTR